MSKARASERQVPEYPKVQSHFGEWDPRVKRRGQHTGSSQWPRQKKNAGQGKAPGEGSLHTGLNSLLSAREGKAESAHGAGLEREGTEQLGEEAAAQQQTPGEITSSPHRFVIVS